MNTNEPLENNDGKLFSTIVEEGGEVDFSNSFANGRNPSQDDGAKDGGEIPGNIFQSDSLDLKNISTISGLHRYSEDEDAALVPSDVSTGITKTENGLDAFLKYKDEEDTISSEDEDYDDDDLLSVASTMQNVSSMSLRRIEVLPAHPTPLNELYWCEPCAMSFRVRGAGYAVDRKKTNSEPSVFRLITVDLCQVTAPIKSGFCSLPKERVQQALRREKERKTKGDMPPFIFCVNILIPGPPFYHFVFYYAVDDMSQIKPQPDDQSDPFNKLASKFFFGESDKFRDSTFKLIPRIVSGNLLVKKAVGSKPTIIGKKLKQSYIRGERFFEVIVDIGSSVIASKVVRLAKGYAKNIVVDMGFLLEGKDASCLPERMLGTVRLTNVDFKSELRSVDKP